MIHKCKCCPYLTTLKSNLTRHIMRKHENEQTDLINSNHNDDKNDVNVNIPILNDKNPQIIFQCDKCNKNLSTNKILAKHKQICKGVKNSLECPKCHKIFASRQSKSYHIKTCTAQSLLTVSESHHPSSITNNNNTTNISGDQNNTVNNTVNNTNITILAVDPNKLDQLAFVTDHITNPELKNILKLTHQDVTDSKKVNMLETYMRHLLANPVNKCIQKTNMQNGFSKIHTGENNWEIKHDKELYPKLTCNVAQGFSGLMLERNDEANMIKTERKLEELRAFLDYMSDEGYRNDSDETKNHQTHLIFKELVQRIKGVVFEVTKIKL